jgi:hypothetical protein
MHAPGSGEAAPTTALPASEDLDPGRPRRQVAKWIALGGVGLYAASLGLSVYERVQYDKYVVRDANGGLTATDAMAANRARDIARYYGTGLFVAGTAALGVAAYMYLTAPPEVVRRTIVTPTASGDQVGVSLLGSF